MSDSIISSTPPKKRRRWLRWLAWSTAVLLVLIIVAYFVGTSSAFLKQVILPGVGKALKADITVSDAVIHPFSGISLRDLKVQAAGQPPLVTAPEVRVRYHLFDILGGNFHVDEITIVSPTIQLVEAADGRRNWEFSAKTAPAKLPAKTEPAAATGAGKPLRIDLGKLTLSNATILQIKNYADGRRDFSGLTNVNVTLANLKNGQTAKLDLSAELRVENQSATNSGGRLAATLKGSFTCAFNSDLKPGAATGGVNFAVAQAAGAFSEFDSFSAALDCEVTPTAINQLALRFQKSGGSLGELAISGPFDAEKMEGKLDVALRGVDRRLLNLFGEKNGLDFGTTRMDATNQIVLAKNRLTVTGRFNAGQVQLTRARQTTPTLDLNVAYDMTVDHAAQTATLRSLNLAGTQNGAPLLSAQLTSPMSLAWGAGAGGLGDAELDLVVTELKLADWKPFAGDLAAEGKAAVKLKVSSQQGGKKIAFDLNADVQGLAVQFGSNRISQAEITVAAHGQAAEFKQITLSDYQVQLGWQNQSALTVSGSGDYDLASGEANAQVKLQAALAQLLKAMPQPGMSVSFGDVELNARVALKQKLPTLTGDLTLANFNGQIGRNEFLGYSSRFKLDVAGSPEQIQINRIAGDFSQNGNSGGGFDVSGIYRLAQKSARVNLKLAGLNENGLRPFLEPLLADKKLASVSVNGVVAGQYDPQAGSEVKADVRVENFVVTDPRQKAPAPPLAIGLQLDAALNRQVAEVRQFQIALAPTPIATNQLYFSGRLDFSNSNAVQGNLKLAADALDLTRYNDLCTGGSAAPAKTAATTTSAAPASAKPDQEPPAVKLPLRNFTLAVDLRRLYLHELAVSNFLTTVKIDGSQIALNPFELALNGAPVAATADVDLGVPGYKYNVTFTAKKVPLAPLMDTFQPARAGQMGGTLTAAAQITGAGVTGTGLQKNLAGKFDLDMTNLNLSVLNVHSRIIKTVINVIATIPELLSRPENAIISLLGGVTGRGGLMNELEQSPIEVIAAHVTAGGGRVNLRSATVQSSAFKADATGGLALAPVLTNSAINIPVTVALSRAIAKKMNTTSTAASASDAYVPLPPFLTMSGTVGNPQANIDKLALVRVAGQSVGGSLLNNVGTNASPVGNLLKGFLNR